MLLSKLDILVIVTLNMVYNFSFTLLFTNLLMLSYYGFVFFILMWYNLNIFTLIKQTIHATTSPLVTRNLGLKWRADHTHLWDRWPWAPTGTLSITGTVKYLMVPTNDVFFVFLATGKMGSFLRNSIFLKKNNLVSY